MGGDVSMQHCRFMKNSWFSRLTVLAFSLASSLAVQAHNIWIEEVAGSMVLRFGEIGEKIETSPGRLDAFIGVQAWSVATNQFKVEKKADHFLFHSAVATAPVLAEEALLAVSSRTNQAPRKTMFYARWQPAKAVSTVPGLTLDVVPTGKAGEYQVYFRGQPLAGAKVKAEGAKDFRADMTADAEGKFTFTAPAKGLFLLVCAHRENLPGFAGGKAYEGLNHSSTLSFHQP